MSVWTQEKNKAYLWAVYLLLTSLLTRLISFIFPLNYDEWYYLASWNSIKNGGILYQSVLDNKPPLAYFLYIIPDSLSLYGTLSILSAVIGYFISKIVENIYAGYTFLLITAAIPSYLELNLEYWILSCIIPAYYYVLKKNCLSGQKLAYFLCGASLMIKQHSLLLIIPLVMYGLLCYLRMFRKSIYYIVILPILCFLYVIYTDTLYDAYTWIIDYNFWYKNMSETGKYIWKRFLYGQLFALPLYLGLLFCIRNIKKDSFHFVLIAVLWLSIGSTWIGKALYLHYQLLIFPFLILVFYTVCIQKITKYAYISILCITVLGQMNCLYTYLYGKKTWITRIEGVMSYKEQKNILPLKTNKPVVFSAMSTIGIDYRNVKYVVLCRNLEYIQKRKNNTENRLLPCYLFLKNAIYVVDKQYLSEYIGTLPYKIVYEYQNNVGIEIETCK